MSRIDKKLEKLGFKKVDDMNSETRGGVYYERYNDKHKYNQRVDIYYKASGDHMLLSYEEGTNTDMFNNVVGLTYQELKLFMAKFREMRRKYKW